MKPSQTRLEFRISRQAKVAFAKYAKNKNTSMGRLLKDHIAKLTK